jgi:hypothetical protein
MYSQIAAHCCAFVLASLKLDHRPARPVLSALYCTQRSTVVLSIKLLLTIGVANLLLERTTM